MTDEPGTPTPAPAEEPAAPAASQEPETPVEPEASEISATIAPVAGTENEGLVAYLKTELAAANQKLTDMTVKEHALQSQVDAMNATHSQMRTIVEDHTNLRKIALGGTRSDLTQLSDEALLQTFNQYNSEFNKLFPVGGRAIPPSSEEMDSGDGAVITPLHNARINSVRVKKTS